LHGANMVKRVASLTSSGSAVLAAGNIATIGGFGVNDGNYLIEQARHQLTRENGYTTQIDARSLTA
jgi:uncharacterized protein